MQINLLLEKYKKLGFSQKRIKEIINVVFNSNNLKVEFSDIEVKDSEVKLLISGTKRTHFILMKKKIEEQIQKELEKEGIKISKIY